MYLKHFHITQKTQIFENDAALCSNDIVKYKKCDYLFYFTNVECKGNKIN